MNINEEGKYYTSTVRKFRTEYTSKNLRGFCKGQNVSYIKMLHCLRNDPYHKPSTKPMNSYVEQVLHPLVAEAAGSAASSVDQEVNLLLDDIELNFGSKISLHIGSCSKSALVSLIKEMEGTLC